MTPPDPQLLRSLGKLARGLSALFWGLPAALLVCAETARADWLKPLGILPPLAVNALLLFGLMQMGSFQKQERPWRAALDRANFFALINLGLCPFIYWHNKLPEQFYFNLAVVALELSAVLFLFNLNVVLKRLGAMLPDETLRQETRQFTTMNCWLLFALIVFALAQNVFAQIAHPPPALGIFISLLERAGRWLLIFFALLPLAMSMALIWKTKEVILDSVFGASE